jgi:type VI secretion system protein ImpL
MFRLLQSESLTRRPETDYVARWSLGGGTVELPLHAASLRNPFLDDTLQAFRCGDVA